MVDKFVKLSKSSERCLFLKDMIDQKKTFDLQMVSELMSLDLPKEEMMLLMQVASNKNSIELEGYITKNLLMWDQDVAVSALLVWNKKTKHELEHRLRWIANSQYASQRVRYTILLFAEALNMQAFLTDVCEDSMLGEFSPAYHALILEQSIKYNFQNVRLDHIAKSYLEELKNTWKQIEKSHVPSIIYLKKYKLLPDDSSEYSDSWQWVLKAIKQSKTAMFKGQSKEPDQNVFMSKLQQSEEIKFKKTKTFPAVGNDFTQSSILNKLDELVKQGDQKALDEIAKLARETSGIYLFSYLKAFGSFKGNDQAVLKLLDYIRIEEEYLLKQVIASLASIGTPRAGGELLAMIQRPNTSPELELFIASSLGKVDHSKMQSQLNTIIVELKEKAASPEDTTELIESLNQLIDTKTQTTVTKSNTFDADQQLQDGYKNFKNLSGEVRRALRTGMFFHQEVQKQSHVSVDLSPVIDMQYKAIELYLREGFESRCTALVKSGILQRKLDIIGYARPIPEKMSQFERYMSSLPEISKIPFFSKFKLRKMLRALCQYRPGKRFTLDGLKAFALFFLCFSRSECKYGLANIFPLGFPNNKQLYLFICELHRFQDFRNRAVHEGLPPDIVEEIDQTWNTTYSILEQIDRLLEIESHMKQINQAKGA